MAIEVGSVVEGVVTGLTRFGAFVKLPDGVTGLVHISEVADTYVKDVKDYLKENDRVQVKIINVGDDGKVGLSIKQANPNYKTAKPRNFHRKISNSFEDKLARFLKESDEKQQDIRRNTESKRGGRGTSRFS